MKDPKCTKEDLFHEIADLVGSLDLNGVNSIGYCFSYPAASTLKGDETTLGDVAEEGDSILLRWTKGVSIPKMVGHLVGKELMEYLNKTLKGKAEFKIIKIINDTIASLFAGLTDTTAQAYIGLIVGTGTNMAALFPSSAIPKLDKRYKKILVPVNLESGNFYPPFLSAVDDKIDRYSDSPGSQRFEKAISGMYLGRILEYVFSTDEFEADFDAAKLTRIMSYPDMYKDAYVEWAHRIYERSAKLVAASLAGLVFELVAIDPSIKIIRLVAEGSLFWSYDKKGKYCYKDMVMAQLNELLAEAGLKEVTVKVDMKVNANLIGSAIAGLS
jgi:hexokinase